MEAMKNVRSAYVFDLKLLKDFYLVFGIYYKTHSIREISIGEGKYQKNKKNKKKKTIWLILLGVQLLRVNADQMTWENDFCWFILLGLIEGKCWSKSYVI